MQFEHLSDLDQVIATRCRQLADGAEPDNYHDGICWDVMLFADKAIPDLQGRESKLGNTGAVYVVYGRLNEIFVALGYNGYWPLGPHYLVDRWLLWKGDEGDKRRRLCREVFQYLVGQDAAAAYQLEFGAAP